MARNMKLMLMRAPEKFVNFIFCFITSYLVVLLLLPQCMNMFDGNCDGKFTFTSLALTITLFEIIEESFLLGNCKKLNYLLWFPLLNIDFTLAFFALRNHERRRESIAITNIIHIDHVLFT